MLSDKKKTAKIANFEKGAPYVFLSKNKKHFLISCTKILAVFNKKA